MKQIGSFMLLLLIILLVGLLAIAVIIAWSLGLGWLLQQVVPVLSLFEAGLLILAATSAVFFTVQNVALAERSSSSSYEPIWGDDDDEDDEDDDDEMPLSLDRFTGDEDFVTQEISLRYQLTNAVYLNLVSSPDGPKMMTNAQLEALAVRLVDVIVAVLKRKPRNTPRVSLTIGAMKKELDRMGQRPYDDDILQIALGTANMLFSFDDDLADIVREKSWNEESDDY